MVGSIWSAVRTGASAAALLRWRPRVTLTGAATAMLFLALFAGPAGSLVRDWWSDPEAAHGLLLGPLALGIAWRRGWRGDAHPRIWLGAVILLSAVALRYVADLAAELFTLRVSILLAAAGLLVFYRGWRQLMAWTLPFALLFMCIPLPSLVLSTLSFPLQLRASAMGAALLDWRHVPVELSGNIIQLPGQQLFVTEACSGLRSLSALIALGLLMGSMFLTRPVSRVLVLLLSVPVAMLVNGLRVFMTGYLVHYGNPSLGRGFMHFTEGWLLFIVALAVLGCVTYTIASAERWRARAVAS